MINEYKDILIEFEILQIKIEELEKIISLIKTSDALNETSKLQTVSFLEGYMKGLKEKREWLKQKI